MSAYDPRVRHPIMISNEPETFEIPVGMNGPALSRQIDTALRIYVRGYRQDGTGAITIQVPTGSANEIAASSTGQAVHYALVRAGVPHNQILVAPYFVGDHSKAAPLRLSYLRVKAVVPTAAYGRRRPRRSIRTSMTTISDVRRSRTSPPWSPIRPIWWRRSRCRRPTVPAGRRSSRI